MPTSWKISDKTVYSGPTWDAMSTDVTDDYDELTGHKWEWTSDWIFGEKIGASSPTWTITTNTKTITGTET